MTQEIVYDTGVLVAAERRDRGGWLRHRRVLQADGAPLVPAPVLAQAWRGGPQPVLSRFLEGCHVVPMTEALARVAGTAGRCRPGPPSRSTSPPSRPGN